MGFHLICLADCVLFRLSWQWATTLKNNYIGEIEDMKVAYSFQYKSLFIVVLSGNLGDNFWKSSERKVIQELISNNRSKQPEKVQFIVLSKSKMYQIITSGKWLYIGLERAS